MAEILILGGGPAGLAAAIAARGRGVAVTVLSNPISENPLWRAPRVDNYPGMPGVTGAQLLQAMEDHAREMGARLVSGRVLSALTMEGGVYLTVGGDVLEGGALILATGVARGGKYPGEERLLGRGVSYCASCDGMLYRGRRVVVIGRSPDAPEEARYLAGIGCAVTYAAPGKRPEELDPEIPFLSAGTVEIRGEEQVTGVRLGESEVPCDAVFILRRTVAPTDLLPQLETEGGYLKVDRAMRTNLSGVFAAGDCTGAPLQAAKAVGEGLIAGQAAAAYLEAKQK